MNRVITINLNGVAYQLEESGYEQLRAYLDQAGRQLEGNPDRDEILADIEQAIADKFRVLLGSYKTVVVTSEVAEVIKQMGPVQDASAADAAGSTAGAKSTGSAAAAGGAEAGSSGLPRRLYRISDGAMFMGVCNGLSAYLNVDVSFIRIGFVLLSVFWGMGLLVYFGLGIILPQANTPEEKTAAMGAGATAEEFIRRARAGYYEGARHFHDRQARREWKRKFKAEMREWKYSFRRQAHETAAQWSRATAPSADRWASIGLTFMILTWTRLLCFFLAFYAVFSLVVHHGVFGFTLPADIPALLAVIGVCFVYHFVSWPLKVMRRSLWRSHGWHGGLAGPLDGIVWLALFLGMVWFADHSSPAFHTWLQDLPPAIHHTVADVKEWWARR